MFNASVTLLTTINKKASIYPFIIIMSITNEGICGIEIFANAFEIIMIVTETLKKLLVSVVRNCWLK